MSRIQSRIPGRIREPAVAGRFYPANATELRSTIRRCLDEADNLEAARQRETAHANDVPISNAPPKGIIAPHAGYVYSGPVAATAYSRLLPLRGRIERVVLFGPAHYGRVVGMAVPSAEAFDTPLGRVAIDVEAVRQASELPCVVVNDEAHAQEHSLEVHIPFLQEVLGDFRLVPFAVGEATAEEVGQVMELMWGGPETLFVVSSDLSHFHDHDTALRLDGETSRLIESLRFEELTGERCCGFRPIGGLLQAARARGLRARTLDLRNSGDTAGPRDRVVGYGAYVVE
jgi:MEMO1 family protein